MTETSNGNGNGRATVARVSQQIADLDKAFGDLRHGFGDHVKDGQAVLQRLAAVEARIDMGLKLLAIMVAGAGVATAIYAAVTQT